MPLVKTTLELQLKTAFEDAMNKFLSVARSGGLNDTSNQAILQAAQEFSGKASTAIDAYIKSATIIVPPGQVVATAGTPAAQTGATTAPSPPAQIS